MNYNSPFKITILDVLPTVGGSYNPIGSSVVTQGPLLSLLGSTLIIVPQGTLVTIVGGENPFRISFNRSCTVITVNVVCTISASLLARNFLTIAVNGDYLGQRETPYIDLGAAQFAVVPNANVVTATTYRHNSLGPIMSIGQSRYLLQPMIMAVGEEYHIFPADAIATLVSIGNISQPAVTLSVQWAGQTFVAHPITFVRTTPLPIVAFTSANLGENNSTWVYSI